MRNENRLRDLSQMNLQLCYSADRLRVIIPFGLAKFRHVRDFGT